MVSFSHLRPIPRLLYTQRACPESPDNVRMHASTVLQQRWAAVGNMRGVRGQSAPGLTDQLPSVARLSGQRRCSPLARPGSRQIPQTFISQNPKFRGQNLCWLHLGKPSKKTRIFYGQADRKGWPHPIPPLRSGVLCFFWGVHLTSVFDYTWFETNFDKKKCFLTLCMTLWLCEDEHFK